MTTTIKEIQELKEYLHSTYHNLRVKEQEEDERYISDTFNVPYIKEQIAAVRTGKGFRMVNAPAEHIITSNPQFFRDGKGNAESKSRVASECNRWLRVMTRQNPQPFKQFVKYLLGRGEGWLFLQHNNDFQPEDSNDLPVDFILLDPLVCFADRTEHGGIPARFLIIYNRMASTIHESYPSWTWENRKSGAKDTEKIPFFMYYDKDVRYFEADGELLLTESDGKPANGDGLQQNIYGFVPAIHGYSGFGLGSVDNDPAYLAVSRIRHCRHLIAEYTGIRSVINDLIYNYAHPPMDLMYDPTIWTPPDKFRETYDRSPNSFNLVPVTQGGGLKKGVDMLPDQQLFTHLYNIERDIDKEDPLGTIAGAIGTSGRQQDIAEDASLRRYDTVVENTAQSFATAFGLALRMIERIPSIRPSGIKATDIGDNYECRVELKATDPIAQDRLRTLGSRLYQQGELDLETNLTKYQGYTEEEARGIMARILADNATRNNPVIAAIMGEQAAKEIGMEEQYAALKMAGQAAEKTLPPTPNQGERGGQPREGNIQSPVGQEMTDMSLVNKGQRMSPQRAM